MIQSMTGYGKTSFEILDKKVNIEIKTLNSKQLDVNCKLSSSYRSKEIDIRNRLARLLRGKIDFCMYNETQEQGAAASINKEVIASYYTVLGEIADEIGVSKSDLLPTILRLPDVMTNASEELTDEIWEIIFKEVDKIIGEVEAFRMHEGELLSKDILMRIQLIGEKMGELAVFEAERMEYQKERLRKQLGELENVQIDNNRFEQELIYYFEKLDITEEIIRLRKHLDYFNETVHNSESQGKKLGFICQEIGREINTIGSKSNHAEMQKIIVQMKDELEKIKEQLGNIL